MKNKFLKIMMIGLLAIMASGCVTHQIPDYERGPAKQVTLPQADAGDDYIPAMASVANNVQQVDVIRMAYIKALGFTGGRSGRPRLPDRDKCRITLFKAGSANGLPAENCEFPEQTRFVENLLFTFDFKGYALEFEFSSFPHIFVEGGYYETGIRIGPLAAMPGNRRREKQQIVVKFFLPPGTLPE